MKYTITEEQLLQLLDRAYEAGWAGYKDLKESKINELFDDFIKANPPLSQKVLFSEEWVSTETSPVPMSYIITTA